MPVHKLRCKKHGIQKHTVVQTCFVCASEAVVATPSASDNIDHTAALKAELLRIVYDGKSSPGTEVDFDKLAARLNAAIQKQHCV
jgi:hypothetical protein